MSNATADPEFIDIDETCRIIGGKNNPVHPATYYRGVKAGIYPPPDHPSPGISPREPSRVGGGAAQEN